jgi:hypothetical protein
MVQWQNTSKWCRGAWVQLQFVMFITFSLWHPWEPRFKSGFHNSFWVYCICSSWQNTMNDFGIIWMKFGNEFWLIIFREYVSPKLYAVQYVQYSTVPGTLTHYVQIDGPFSSKMFCSSITWVFRTSRIFSSKGLSKFLPRFFISVYDIFTFISSDVDQHVFFILPSIV